MKILLVSTFENSGGAAIATFRLAKALRNSGVSVHLLVRDKQRTDSDVEALPSPRWVKKWRFLYERILIWVADGFRRENLFQVSLGNTGADITKLDCFKKADIVHLHWINQGMMSLQDVKRVAKTEKPIVWTMHDTWNATAIRHCDNTYPQHHRAGLKWLAHQVYKAKKRLYDTSDITFVACSRWLYSLCKSSSLLKHQPLVCIPNPIDIDFFKPSDQPQDELRKRLNLPTNKKLLLFASMNVADPRKGFSFFEQACKILAEDHPDYARQIEVVVVGKDAEQVTQTLSLPVHPIGFVREPQRMVEIYNAVDAYLTTSLVDNLPNTVMEPMACGTPCIGYATGGIPEMIDHKKNGYVAQHASTYDLINGIIETLFGQQAYGWGGEARKKVEQCYAEKVVVQQYMQLYRKKLQEQKKNKKLTNE